MKQLAEKALDMLKSRGVDYGDVRVEDIKTETIYFRNVRVDTSSFNCSEGFGVRALVNGSWGFASSSGLSRENLENTVDRAVAIARSAEGMCGAGTRLATLTVQTGEYKSPCKIDPFSVSREKKIDLLTRVSEIANDSQKISLTRTALWFEKRNRVFGNTEGSLVSTELIFSYPFLIVYATDKNDAQNRSLQDGARLAGWEWIEEQSMLERAESIREEAIMKVMAEEPSPGKYDLVLEGLHLSLTMHESVGHPTESDRALGWEANMAGRTFLTTEDRNTLRYGSEIVNLVADNTLPYGLASWGWDDEGVPGQKWFIVKNGIFQEFGTVRETASILSTGSSRGCCRAQDFSHFPINRQPNFYLEPGKEPLTPDEIIADTKKGIFIEGRGSFSIGQRRLNFQFGGDFFWEIKDGKKVRPLKKVIYRSTTPEFWGSCDAIADKRFFRTMGVLTCGKGEPVQAARMTHGSSPARFREITVGGEIK